jgi:maltose phosphorylase
VQWSADKDAYVILGVTGPNEYENNVNNNWYTNYLAAWCMRYALEVAQWLKSEHPSDWSRLTAEYTISEASTFEAWSQIPDQMYLPQLEDTEVRLQQDGFMDKEQRSVDDLSEEQRPINQKWSWDRILRSIFIKQADVLQGLYFFWDDFLLETHHANYEFYEPKTVHESSLSPCVHSIIASRLDRMDDAYKHYLRTSRLDLDDYNKEVHEGLHITSMAGTWLSVVEGFGGFDVKDGIPHFNGKLPTDWQCLRFKINFRNRLLDVVVSEEGTSVALIAGQPIDVKVNGQVKRLDAQGH